MLAGGVKVTRGEYDSLKALGLDLALPAKAAASPAAAAASSASTAAAVAQ